MIWLIWPNGIKHMQKDGINNARVSDAWFLKSPLSSLFQQFEAQLKQQQTVISFWKISKLLKEQKVKIRNHPEVDMIIHCSKQYLQG